MPAAPSYCFYRTLDPAPPGTITFDRHYLLYSVRGALRLIDEDRAWSLPPSRAAWIAAETPIHFEIKHPVTCCSVLYSVDAISAPEQRLRVFEMSPLARDMVHACRTWNADRPFPHPLADSMFQTLALLCRDLAASPSNCWIPRGRTDRLRKAIDFTEARLDQSITIKEAASAAGLSPRSLARRFADEIGMTWRQVQRRMRMIRAIEILANEADPVTQVAFRTGYNSLSAFNAAFREFTGFSPSEYRAFSVD
ncbi:MAG: AraC family transcriptional regulator [Rhizobiaceae bacterium MnEN-MB40S]|nr:MAG: AraC family transcriptional regulator [Rhizobiaceae bacterium MnEN-MB40S]